MSKLQGLRIPRLEATASSGSDCGLIPCAELDTPVFSAVAGVCDPGDGRPGLTEAGYNKEFPAVAGVCDPGDGRPGLTGAGYNKNAPL